jgi:hypothetical protein
MRAEYLGAKPYALAELSPGPQMRIPHFNGEAVSGGYFNNTEKKTT